MGSMRCFCGYGMRNSDSINQIELSLFRMDDIKKAITENIMLKDLPFRFEEVEVWRCPVCGRWDFISAKYNYRMVPVKPEESFSCEPSNDDITFIEFDSRSADNAYTISGNITVSDFLKLDEDKVQIRYLRVNSARMLLYRNSEMQKPVKIYKQEK